MGPQRQRVGRAQASRQGPWAQMLQMGVTGAPNEGLIDARAVGLRGRSSQGSSTPIGSGWSLACVLRPGAANCSVGACPSPFPELPSSAKQVRSLRQSRGRRGRRAGRAAGALPGGPSALPSPRCCQSAGALPVSPTGRSHGTAPCGRLTVLRAAPAGPDGAQAHRQAAGMAAAPRSHARRPAAQAAEACPSARSASLLA